MKFLKQFAVILLISFAGEFLHDIIPLPVPVSIYGIIILFLCLELKIIKVDDVKETSSFLISVMPVMFIPPAVGLMTSWSLFSDKWIQYIVITVVTTFAVMIVSGRVTQAVIKKSRNKEKIKNESVF